MRRMGGLKLLVPKALWVMTLLLLAIAGFPPFAGFFSKDEILAQTFMSPYGGPVLWAIGVITAGLTSFYMFRLWFMTFFGKLKLGEVDVGEEAHAATAPAQAGHGAAAQSHGHADDQAHDHGGVHESPWVMLAPLMVLALGSIVAGWVGVPAFVGGHNEIGHFLAPAIQTPADVAASAHLVEASRQPAQGRAESTGLEWALAVTSVGVAALGMWLAWLFYYKRPELPERITTRIHGLYLTVLHKYYVDEGYNAIFVKPLLALSTVVFWRGVDQGVIDGLVNGAGETSKKIGNELRLMQSGNIRSYAAWVAAGGALVIAYMVWLGVSK